MTQVVQILYSGLGGHGSVVFSLIGADKSGAYEHSCIFYGVADLVQDYKNMAKEHHFDYSFFLKKGGLDLATQKAIYKQINELDSPVIILHQPQLLIGAWLFLNRKKTTLIVVEHHPNKLKNAGKWLLSFIAQRRADKVVYLTQTYKKEVSSRASFLFSENKSVVIPNGVNTDVFFPQEKNTLSNQFVFGIAARISDQKNHRDLLSAFSTLISEHADLDLKLRIAGDGPIRAELMTWCDNHHISANVEFTGMLNTDAMVLFYQSLNAYVHTTHSETMSTSVMQAAACGLPIIATNVSGMSDLLPPTTGILVEDNDVTELTDKMKSLLIDSPLRESLGRCAREHALTHLSSNRSWEQYSELFPS